MRERTRTLHIEYRKSLTRSDLSVIGVAARAIEAGDALQDIVMWLRQIYFCRSGLGRRRRERCERDQQQDQGRTQRMHGGLLFTYSSSLLGGLCTELRIL